jgi:hypothetical protein
MAIRSRIKNDKATFTVRDMQRIVGEGHRQYLDHLTTFLNDDFQEVAVDAQLAHSLHIKLSVERQREIYAKMQLRSETAFEVISSYPGAMPHVDKGEVVANMLSLLDSTSHIALEAETQYGKTVSSIFAVGIRALLNERDGNPEYIALVNPGKNIGADQTNNDLEDFVDLHASLHLDGEVYTIQDACKNGLIKSFKRSTETPIDEIDAGATEIGATIITLVIDEGDAASGINSVLDRWMVELRNRGYEVRLLLISATSYPYREIENYKHYKVHIDPNSGYCGTVAGKRTPVLGFTTVSKLVRNPAFADFTLASYTANLSSNNTHRKKDARLQAELLAEVLYECCMNPPSRRGFNGLKFNGGRAGIVRVGSAATTAHFEKHVEPILRKQGIKLVPFYDTHMKRKGRLLPGQKRYKQIDDVLAENDGYCLIVVKGAARRQDRVPAECTLAFDFTDAFSNTIAMEQGTMGRMSGWFKIIDQRSTMVIVSDENEKMIGLFRRDYDKYHEKIPRKNPGSNSIVMENFLPRNGQTLDQVIIDFTKSEYKHLTALRQRFTDVFGHVVRRDDREAKVNVGHKQFGEAKVIQTNGPVPKLSWAKGPVTSAPSDLARSRYLNFDIEAIVGPYWGDLQDAMTKAGVGAKLLRPGTTRPDGVHYPVNEQKHVEIDIRNHFIKYGGKGGRKTSGHNNRTTLLDAKKRRFRVSFDLRSGTPVVHLVTMLVDREYIKFEETPENVVVPVKVGPSARSLHRRESHQVAISKSKMA